MPAAALHVLVFELGGQRYGLLAADVQELVRAVRIVPLPRAPAMVEGIINLRGRVVPVLDLRGRFRLPPRPLEPSDHFIVAQAGQRCVALRVDRAVELADVAAEDVDEAAAVVPGAEYVAWVARMPHNLVLIHDLQTFLSEAESAALDAALPDSSVPTGGPRP